LHGFPFFVSETTLDYNRLRNSSFFLNYFLIDFHGPIAFLHRAVFPVGDKTIIKGKKKIQKTFIGPSPNALTVGDKKLSSIKKARISPGQNCRENH